MAALFSRHAATSSEPRASSAPAREHTPHPARSLGGQRKHDACPLGHRGRQGPGLGCALVLELRGDGVVSVAVSLEDGLGQLLVVEQQRGEALCAKVGDGNAGGGGRRCRPLAAHLRRRSA